MENKFLAKTKPKIETIQEHTKALLREYEVLKETYPNIPHLDWELLRFACLYHDLGKMNTKFQNKLYKNLGYKDFLEDNLQGEEVPHGYLSPAFIPIEQITEILQDKYEEEEILGQLKILYESIYYHHSRAPLDNSDPIKETVKNDLVSHWENFKFDEIVKSNKLKSSFSKYVSKVRRIVETEENENLIYQYIITKGLLNKIDYAASGHTTIEVANEELFQKTYDFLTNGGFQPNKLQQYLIENMDENNIVVASTGIGKTEGALFWIGNNKGFFTLPLRVSINAIYDRVIEKIKYPKAKTALLHSETQGEYLKRNDNVLDTQYYDETKQLSLPLTICTLDQLIDFVFKYEGFELKLATLAYSKLVIDEIQMYSPEMVAYLIVALKYITQLKGKFTILTATFPPVFEYFLLRENVKYKKAEKPFLKEVDGKIQLRHNMKVLQEDINIKYLITNYKNKKVLVIVNTVKKAQELYEELLAKVKDTNINLFHSKFIKKHRAEKEREILSMGELSNPNCGIWITTQVVEASVDIDFDVLYTELSDLSGLFQRMGRVYRNRSLIENLTNIFVYVGGRNLPSGIRKHERTIIDYDIFELSKNVITNYQGSPIDEEEKMKLVEKVYSLDNLKNTEYFKKIKENINMLNNISAYEFNKKEVNLRDISNVTVIPKSVYEENKKEIEEAILLIKEFDTLKNLKSSQQNIITAMFNKRLIAVNSIKEFTISIPTYEFENIKKKNLLSDVLIEVNKYMSFPVVKVDYSYEKGFQRAKEKMLFDEEEQFI